MPVRPFAAAAVFENSVRIGRPVEDVFDYASDVRNELEWNPDCRSVEALTPGPIRAGSRFRVQWSGSPPMDVEVTAVERPHRWTAFATSRGLDVRFHGRVDHEPGGATLRVRMELMPVGRTRLLFPLIRLIIGRGERRNMRLIKQALEGAPVSASAGRSVDGPRRSRP